MSSHVPATLRKQLEHFRIEDSSVNGLTEIGAATASLLCFNIADRVLELNILIRMGRFPSTAALNLIALK